MKYLSRLQYITFIIGCMVLAQAGTAQDKASAKAAEILDRFVSVTGGRTAYDAITNRLIKSEMKDQGQVIQIITYQAKPGKSYQLMDAGVNGKTESGTDGSVVWSYNPGTGPQIISGAIGKTMIGLAVFDRITYWKSNFTGLDVKPAGEVDGKACHIVEAVAVTGDTLMLYFEKSTGYLLRFDMFMQHPQAGKVVIENYQSDFRKVDGILLPFSTAVVIQGQKNITTVKTIEQNIEIPADTFLPDNIQRFLEIQKEQ